MPPDKADNFMDFSFQPIGSLPLMHQMKCIKNIVMAHKIIFLFKVSLQDPAGDIGIFPIKLTSSCKFLNFVIRFLIFVMRLVHLQTEAIFLPYFIKPLNE